MSMQNFNAAIQNIQLNELKNRLRNSRIEHVKKNRRVAFYSTFCGPTRAMSLSAPVHHIDADFFFISNNPDCLKSAKKLGWLPFHLNVEVLDDAVISAHQAKIAKALPHLFEFLEDYEKVFYADDKFHFNKNILSSVDSICSSDEYPLIVSYHPFLSKNILYELAEAMGQPRYFRQREQAVNFILKRLEEGFNLEVEKMYATGLIMRNMRHPDIRRINEDWYQFILECGIECQLAFAFIAQKYPSIRGFDSKILNIK